MQAKTYKVFDEYFERYDLWFRKNKAIAESEYILIRSMIRGSPRPWLEIGVGTGYYASLLGVDIGIDPSVGMIGKARSRGIPLLAVSRGEDLPFREESIGTVLIIVTICFVDDPSRVLDESNRVLKPNGILVLCVVPRDSAWGEEYIRKGLRGHPLYRLARFYTRREIMDMIDHAGFRIVDAAGVLSFSPRDTHRFEHPSSKLDGKGFICFKAKKA